MAVGEVIFYTSNAPLDVETGSGNDTKLGLFDCTKITTMILCSYEARKN